MLPSSIAKCLITFVGIPEMPGELDESSFLINSVISVGVVTVI